MQIIQSIAIAVSLAVLSTVQATTTIGTAYASSDCSGAPIGASAFALLVPCAPEACKSKDGFSLKQTCGDLDASTSVQNSLSGEFWTLRTFTDANCKKELGFVSVGVAPINKCLPGEQSMIATADQVKLCPSSTDCSGDCVVLKEGACTKAQDGYAIATKSTGSGSDASTSSIKVAGLALAGLAALL
jgi:hypothetical protein